MTTAGPVATQAPVLPDEVTAVHGARWIATAAVTVGALNYVYALALTRLLDVGAYATFAAGQGLIVCTAAIAVVTVPWMLAQALARARSDAERGEAVRFAVVTGVAGGIVAAAVVGAVATEFAGFGTTLVIGVSTLLIYVTRVCVGWLQGTERLRTLAALTVVEAGLKLLIGLFFVSALGLGETGALAAFGIAVVPFVVFRPRRFRSTRRRPWRAATANRDLWRRAVGVASLQGVIAVLAALDVVMVAMLPTVRSDAASYQASVMLGRVPLFLAAAVSIAFLPALSRRRAGTPLAARAMGMYLTVALPLTVVAATAPGAVLNTVFPDDYTKMSTLMACTAVAGLALGALSLLVTFAQAVNDYAVLRPLLVGLVCYVTGLTTGWAVGGVLGMALGGMCGTVVALGVLLLREARRHGLHAHGGGRRGAAPLARLAPPLVLAGVLLALRPHAVAWLLVATVTTTVALWRFFARRGAPVPQEPGASGPDGTGPEGTEPGVPDRVPYRRAAHLAWHAPRADGDPGPDGDGPHQDTEIDRRPVRILVDAVWRDDPPPASDEELRAALDLARLNQVEGRLSRAYPRRLGSTLDEVSDATRLFRHNLVESTDRLGAAGIPSVLIKADLSGDHVHGDFDLVVPPDRWKAAEAALDGWCVRRSTYWPERSGTVLLEPAEGPAAHLRTGVCWFGVPVMDTERLFAHAVPDRDGRAWFVPCPADRLRIWLADGLFRNLSLDLSELLALRELLAPEVVAEARAQTAREGWSSGADRTLAVANDTMARLDRGEPVRLPSPLPVGTTVCAGAAHAGHLLVHGRAGAAVREMALRVPLVVTRSVRGRPS
ncbi:lipopolysaccharide biosynthesis protein [Streptomyces sp. NPDC047971]|uniref:lipopolysaccharide biosynthesis protein n=1 Tax=Streptomyces sp. NPDC047971 TaxID=3154499 RepID=UPI0033DA128C